MRSSWIDLDGEALGKNIALFRSLIPAEKLCFVLKSNAYGHGLAEIYQLLAPFAPAYLGVNTIGEALELRSMGYQGRVIVLALIADAALPSAAEAEIEYFLTTEAALAAWLASPVKPKIHLKFNTGLNRQGIQLHRAYALSEVLRPYHTQVVGICSHFANVEDASNHRFARKQLDIFRQACQIFAEQGYQLKAHHASSASGLILPESHFDLVRVGISLYGLWPSSLTRLSYYAERHPEAEALHPVLSWRCQISAVHPLNAGEYVGYGCTFRASRSMVLALLPVGYYEGYPRLAGGQGGSYVLVKGQRCPLVGRLSMNMMVVDVSGVEGVAAGEIATLIGSDGDERVTVDDLASWSQTINYEVVARLNSDLPRKII